MRRDTVVFNGDRYHRYPDSEHSHLQNYYWAHPEQGSPISLHREKWKHHNGEIPDDHVIHHKDGDHTNNDIENLECMPKSEHMSMHTEERFEDEEYLERQKEHLAEIREKATEWHQSEEGQQWHTEHYERVKEELHKRRYTHECVVCGEEYESTRESKTKFCSRSCENKDQYQRYQEERECICCGVTFETSKYADTKTCNASCAANFREGNC